SEASVFKAAFRETWRRIPEPEREAIAAHWGQGEKRIACVFLRPLLADAIASTSDEGDILEFDSSRALLLDPRELQMVIARELAHVRLIAARDPDHNAERRRQETLARWEFGTS